MSTPNAEIAKALSSITASPRVLDLLARLHAEALAEPAFLSVDIPPSAGASAVQEATQQRTRELFVALDPDKCALVYLLLRASGARTAVEAGTSFGVSTVYLALAVGQNVAAAAGGGAGAGAGGGKVIATECQPSKASRARENWALAGEEEVAKWIDLREGDLLETLKTDLPEEVDFLLLDIWTPLALPTLKLVQPRLKKGAMIVADNIDAAKTGYKEFLEYVDQEGSGFKSTVLPYGGGLKLVVYVGSE